MTNPNMTIVMMIMFMILIVNLLTTKTSIMCLNLMLYTMASSMIMSMKIKLTPIPFIVFLTMIGGLMIIFLYLTATLWMKKETLTLKTKIMTLAMTTIPMYSLKTNSSAPLKSSIEVFNPPSYKITIALIIMLTIILVFTIEIHMKMNSPFRRKLKIWE